MAAKAALLLALFAAPALGQPPGGYQQPNTQPGGQVQPGGLPLPPGYRPRTPPPQPQVQPQRPASGAMPGSAGTVMYFQKPADALTATGGGLPVQADGVAQLNAPPTGVPLPIPDVDPVRALPIPDRAVAQPYLRPPAVTFPSAAPTGYATQPPSPQPGDMTSTSEKKKQEVTPPAVDPKEIQLPPRSRVFMVNNNDAAMEKAIMDTITASELKAGRKADPATLVFPTLPVISPPGLPYQPKTVSYAPRTLYIEPGYVVHRRLHFEERNAERQGWDLGPLSTLVAAGSFYRDVLLWPGSLVTGLGSGLWDTSAGKCVPGSPSPYYLYPPGLSTSGWLAEAGIITGVAFLLP